MSVHGVLLVDKPSGITSHDVVSRVRKILQVKEVGHAGTLDPLADGLLVLLLGEGTKTSDILLNAEKGYEATIQLGLTTDSLDITGSVLTKTEVSVDEETIRRTALSMVGELNLPIPAFSAVKVQGEKLLDRALKGEVFTPPSRPMEFLEVEFLGCERDLVSVRIRCAKGAYIRSWAHEFGQKLGCGAAISKLRRIVSSPFQVQPAISLPVLEELVLENEDSWWRSCSAFVALEHCLPEIAGYSVTGKDERLMRGGQVPNDLLRRMIVEQKKVNVEQKSLTVRIHEGNSGRLLSLLEVRPNQDPKIKRVFNYSQPLC